MKHSVSMAFRDKESGMYYMPGSFFISNDEQRIKQLSELSLIKPNTNFTYSEKVVPYLRDVAKQLKIKGYTKMSDAELENAIAEHGGDENDDLAKGEKLTED